MKSIAALSLFAPMVIAAPKAAHACRTLHLVANHEGTQSAYSIAGPEIGAKGMLLLLPGGGEHIDLDADGVSKETQGQFARPQTTFVP